MSEEQPTAPEAEVTEPASAPEATPEQVTEDAAPAAEATPAAEEPAADAPSVGPKIVGVAPEQRPLKVVKQKLREKPAPPKRDPLPFPELRAVVALVGKDQETNELKELFKLLPPKVRDEVVDGVREFRKGARRPLSQHAAKSLARAVHTARRQKRAAAPGNDVGEAIAQAIIGELIASLDVEQAAEVILPKRDLLDREARNARRRQRDEEDKRRDEVRRQRREDAKGFRGQSSFGEFSGTKIKGLDEIAAAFGMNEPEPAPEAEAPESAPEPEATEPEATEPEATPEPEATEPEATPEPEATEPEATPEPEPAAEQLGADAAPQPDPAPEDEAPVAEPPADETA